LLGSWIFLEKTVAMALKQTCYTNSETGKKALFTVFTGKQKQI